MTDMTADDAPFLTAPMQRENSLTHHQPGGEGTTDLPDDPIGRLYDVALDPERYEMLLDSWDATLRPLRQAANFAVPSLLAAPSIADHFDRATKVLNQHPLLNGTEPDDRLLRCLSSFGKLVAMVIGPDGRLCAMNTAAMQRFDLAKGAHLSDLPIHTEDAPALRDALRRLARIGKDAQTLLRLRMCGSDKIMLLRLHHKPHTLPDPITLIICSEIGWSQNFTPLLCAAFGLTLTEAEVVKTLLQCGSVNEIAARRNRSVATVRVQIKSILAKTETRSQVELVRLMLSVLDMSDSDAVPTDPPYSGSNAIGTADTLPSSRTIGINGGGDRLEALPFHYVTAPDGRRITYLVLGAREGIPLLYFPQAYGLVRWPASAEAFARAQGWRIIVPIRAGWGHSDPFPTSCDVDETVISDCLQILHAESADRCPILSMGDDSYYAIKLAARCPDRICGLIACGGVLPFTNTAQFERMDKWHRFIMASAKYTPHLLPFMVKAGFAMARKMGKRRFVHAVFGNAPADIETFERPEVFEAMITGSEVVLSPDTLAHDSFTRVLTGGFLHDWSAEANALQGHVPVQFILGQEDPQIHPDTLSEFRRAYPWINFDLHADAGRLIFFRKWQEILLHMSDIMPPQRLVTPSGVRQHSP